MATEKTKYRELAKASISGAKNLVISECSKGGYTVAQQMIARDGKAEVAVFMKGAIHIDDKEALTRVRDAINVVLAQCDDGENDW